MDTASPAPRTRSRLLGPALLLSLVGTLLAGAPAPTAVAAAPATTATGAAASVGLQRDAEAPRAGRRPAKVASSGVAFDLANTNNSSVLCLPAPDARQYRVRGRLIGPRPVLDGSERVVTVNVLVHDAGTGGWFFNLRSNPAYDYATQLAKRGQTSLVLDRLGYGSSALGNGTDTCLGAQVHMLHQVVQQLYSGRYDFRGPRSQANPPHASGIVLQGHGTGATIAQLEAARFDDVDGLVLMAPTTATPSQLALDVARGQAQTCLRRTFAPYGDSAREFQRLLFQSAVRPVRRAAVQRRNPTPCGDVASLPGALASVTLSDREVDVPVLVLRGGADARSAGAAAAVTSSKPVTRRTLAGTGSALTLERSAPTMRRTVLRWLRRS